MSDAGEIIDEKKLFKKAAVTFLSYVVLGPPIGAVIIYSWVAVCGLSDPPENAYLYLRNILVVAPFVMVVAVPYSYVLGGIQAGFTGFILALFGIVLERLPIGSAFMMGCLTYLVWCFFTNDYKILQLNTLSIGFFVAHVASAILVWCIARNFWKDLIA
jgi:hypothetical protein